MFSNAIYSAVHGVIGDEMNFVSFLCEVFRPALGMDAASVGDKEEDQDLATPSSCKIEYGSISSL